ncbi:MAG: hypothetical protein IKZ98_05380 [Clostridia bacterium]|nr:hypothetical protein [Clostridia bacterium]
MEIDKIWFPEDLSTETVKGKDASSWSNAQVMDALNQTVRLLTNRPIDPESVVEKNYKVITNEIRRRMQANVENFVLLEYEHENDIEKETGFIHEGDYEPSEYKSNEEAYAALDVLADVDDDIVFIGVHYEDYRRTWNRMIRRKKKRLFYYDDESDEEHLKIEE